MRTAYDGWTALALARLHSPDVVICDISMPGMYGLDLARHFARNSASKTPFWWRCRDMVRKRIATDPRKPASTPSSPSRYVWTS